jgi:segregation and condensation protein B
MEEKEIKSVIESMLFVWGDPLHVQTISDILGIHSEIVRKCLLDLKEEYEVQDRGIQMVEIDNCFQLCTNKKNFPFLEKLCTPVQKKRLTQAALEVLAIIAYKQPITKPEIEEIRGVKCDKAINTLLERGLIVEKGRLEKIGRPILYETTETFLKQFGLTSLKELSPLIDISVFEQFQEEQQAIE